MTHLEEDVIAELSDNIKSRKLILKMAQGI